MTDLYTLRGRALRARLLELVAKAALDGCSCGGRSVQEYAASVVPPVPTRRRTRHFDQGETRYTLTYYDCNITQVHRYHIVGQHCDGYLTLPELLHRFSWEHAETIAACCIDLSTNPDEDIE